MLISKLLDKVGYNIAANIASAVSNFVWIILLSNFFLISEVSFFMLSLSIAAPVYVLCNLDLRRLVSIDISNEFSNGDYLVLRFVFVVIALIFSFIILYQITDVFHLIVLLLLLLSKSIDSISELSFGISTRNDRQINIFKSRAIRLILTIIFYCYVYVSETYIFILVMALYLLSYCIPFALYDWKNFKNTSNIYSRKILKLFHKSKWLGMEALFISLYTSLPLIFLNHTSGDQAVFEFGSVNYFLTAIHLLFSSTIYSALPYFKSVIGNNASYLYKLSCYAVFFSIICMLPLYYIGKDIMVLIFSEKILGVSSEFIVIRVLSTLLSSITILISSGLVILELTKLMMKVRLLKLFSLTMFLVFLTYSFEINTTFIAFAILILNIFELTVFMISYRRGTHYET